MDIWSQCEDYPQYSVSPEGEVKSRQRRRVLKTRQNQRGVVMVNLMQDGVRVTRSVALLVAQAYLGGRPTPAYNSLIHLDGDKSNCHASNLMWRPRWYAVRYHKMFEREPLNVSIMIEDTGEVFGTIREMCMKYGLDETYSYLELCNGERSFHYNFKFRRPKGY